VTDDEKDLALAEVTGTAGTEAASTEAAVVVEPAAEVEVPVEAAAPAVVEAPVEPAAAEAEDPTVAPVEAAPEPEPETAPEAETDDSNLTTPAKFAALTTRLGIEDDQTKPLTAEQIKKISGSIDNDEDYGLLMAQLGSRNQVQFGTVGAGETEKFEMIPRDNKIEQTIKEQLDRAEARITAKEAAEAAAAAPVEAEAATVAEAPVEPEGIKEAKIEAARDELQSAIDDGDAGREAAARSVLASLEGSAPSAPVEAKAATVEPAPATPVEPAPKADEAAADSGLESKRPFSQAESDAAAERLFATYGVEGAKPGTELDEDEVVEPVPGTVVTPEGPKPTAEADGESTTEAAPAATEAAAPEAAAEVAAEAPVAPKVELTPEEADRQRREQNLKLTGKENFNANGSFADRAAVTRAEVEAWSQDREARKLLDVQKYWDERIAGTRDYREKLNMEVMRNNAVEAERNRFKTISQDTVDSAAVILENARVGRFAVDQLVKGEGETPKMLEDKALARREVLGLEPVPFLELKTGGLDLNSKVRGPKVIESYFKAPGLENVVVVERRLRENGELVSQTTYTTKEPIRRRRTLRSVTGLGDRATLPPLEMHDAVYEQRVTDTEDLTQGKDGLFKGRRVREYFSGARTPRFTGLYGSSYGANPREQNKLNSSNKRGGFWFGLFGGF
jgi:hypothetical protein